MIYQVRALALLTVVTATITSCKVGSSTQKSFVGLEAGVDPKEAPSFVLLQKWFHGELPVNKKAAEAGASYKVHTNFTGDTWAAIPQEYRGGILRYFQQQTARVSDFQKNLQNPDVLTNLLKLEALEMKEILLAILQISYEPQTNDLLAQLFRQPNLSSYYKRYSLELQVAVLEKRVNLYNLAKELDTEEKSFADTLIKAYVNARGATPTFVTSLQDNCRKLTDFINSLGAKPEHTCDIGAGGGGMQLGESYTIAQAASQLPGGGQKYANVFGGLFAANGPATAVGQRPNLSIFQGKDPTLGATGAGGNLGNVNVNPYNPAAPGYNPAMPGYNPTMPNGNMGYAQQGGLIGAIQMLLSSSWANQTPTNKMSLSDSGNSLALSSSSSIKLPRKPNFDCKEKGFEGLQLINCYRYYSTLPKLSEMGQSSQSKPRETSASPGNDGFSLNGAYSMFLVAVYGTPVQNQGSEGACTAYGLSHTIEANLQKSAPGFRMDAARQWQAQGQQPYTSEAIRAVQESGVNGHRMLGTQSLNPDVNEIRKVLSQGRAVYAASDIDNSWYNPSGGMMSCGAEGPYGHAYSIQGFDDDKQVFIIKNSWGDDWGESGYYYLPYRCITSFSNPSFDDIQMQ